MCETHETNKTQRIGSRCLVTRSLKILSEPQLPQRPCEPCTGNTAASMSAPKLLIKPKTNGTPLKIFIFIFNYIYLCSCVRVYACGCSCLKRPEESAEFPGAGARVTVSGLMWVLGTEPWSSARAVSTLHCWTIFSRSQRHFLN